MERLKEYEVRKAKSVEKSQVLDLRVKAFLPLQLKGISPDSLRKRFERNQRLPWFKYYDTQWVGVLSGKIISSLHLFTREIRIGRCPILVGDIGAVCTDPNYQKLGYGSELTRKVMLWMEKESYNMSVIFADVPEFYQKLGWENFPLRCMTTIIKEGLNIPVSHLYKYYIAHKGDFFKIVALYNEHRSMSTGSTVRDTTYWDRYFDWVIQENNVLLIMEVKQEPKAFVRLAKEGKDRLKILELCYPKDNNEILLAILQGIVHYTISKKRHIIDVDFLSFNHPFVQSFAKLGFEVEFPENITTRVMIWLINLDSLFIKITPVLEERLRHSSFCRWKGAVTIQSDTKIINFLIRDSTIRVNNERQDGILLPFLKKDLIGLILGDTVPRSLDTLTQLSLTEEEIQLIEVLFPKQEPIHWPVFEHY